MSTPSGDSCADPASAARIHRRNALNSPLTRPRTRRGRGLPTCRRGTPRLSTPNSYLRPTPPCAPPSTRIPLPQMHSPAPGLSRPYGSPTPMLSSRLTVTPEFEPICTHHSTTYHIQPTKDPPFSTYNPTRVAVCWCTHLPHTGDGCARDCTYGRSKCRYKFNTWHDHLYGGVLSGAPMVHGCCTKLLQG